LLHGASTPVISSEYQQIAQISFEQFDHIAKISFAQFGPGTYIYVSLHGEFFYLPNTARIINQKL